MRGKRISAMEKAKASIKACGVFWVELLGDGGPTLLDLRFADDILFFATTYIDAGLLLDELVACLSQVGPVLNTDKTTPTPLMGGDVAYMYSTFWLVTDLKICTVHLFRLSLQKSTVHILRYPWYI